MSESWWIVLKDDQAEHTFHVSSVSSVVALNDPQAMGCAGFIALSGGQQLQADKPRLELVTQRWRLWHVLHDETLPKPYTPIFPVGTRVEWGGERPLQFPRSHPTGRGIVEAHTRGRALIRAEDGQLVSVSEGLLQRWYTPEEEAEREAFYARQKHH